MNRPARRRTGQDVVAVGDFFFISSGVVELRPPDGRLPLLQILNGGACPFWVRPTHAVHGGGASAEIQYDVAVNLSIPALPPLTLLSARAGDPLSAQASTVLASRGTPGVHTVPPAPPAVTVVVSKNSLTDFCPSPFLLPPGRSLVVVAEVIQGTGAQTVSASAEIWF